MIDSLKFFLIVVYCLISFVTESFLKTSLLSDIAAYFQMLNILLSDQQLDMARDVPILIFLTSPV